MLTLTCKHAKVLRANTTAYWHACQDMLCQVVMVTGLLLRGPGLQAAFSQLLHLLRPQDVATLELQVP